MRLKTRQIKFYCTEERYNFLQSIKVRKSASTQSLMNEALNILIELERAESFTPEDPGLYQNTRRGMTQEEHHWVQMWLVFMRDLPIETVEATKQLLQDCIKFFRSSRLVAEQRKKAPRKRNGR